MRTLRPSIAVAAAALLWLAAPASLGDADPAHAAASESSLTAGGSAARLAGPDVPARSRPALARTAQRQGISRGKLSRRLRKLSKRAPGASGYYVFEVGAKKPVVFARKAGKARKLASNEKLFTTATALHRLGAKGRISTRVKARGKLTRGGRLKGDLFLIGGGDPSLGASGLSDLAHDVHRAGIRKVTGNLFADDSIFDRRRGVPDSGWGPSPYIAPLSGLVYGGSTYSGDPAKAAAGAFEAKLRKVGVRVKGKVKRRPVPGKLRRRAPIGRYASPKIAALVAATNKPSNNFYAEMLLKRLWAKPGRKGTTNGGIKAVRRYARSAGAHVRPRDGSGLTDGNRAAPRDVVRLLVNTQRDREVGKPLFRSLAIAGRDGTLDGRMEGTAAAKRCRGKTGTINGVSNLSGLCRSGKRLVAFSLLMNGVYSYDSARAIQDKMAVEIARYAKR